MQRCGKLRLLWDDLSFTELLEPGGKSIQQRSFAHIVGSTQNGISNQAPRASSAHVPVGSLGKLAPTRMPGAVVSRLLPIALSSMLL